AKCFFGCLDHPGVMGQPEVVVRTDHDLAFTVDDDFGVVRGLDRDEVRVVSGGLDLPGLCEPVTLFEQTHPISIVLERTTSEPALVSIPLCSAAEPFGQRDARLE